MAYRTEQKDTRSGSDTNVRQMADPTSAVNINMGTLVGSYASVARMLDEVAAVPGTDGVLRTFDGKVPAALYAELAALRYRLKLAQRA